MTYKKGKDGKIKNIEELNSVENRGIQIIHKTDKIETIFANGRGFVMISGVDDKPEGFEGW